MYYMCWNLNILTQLDHVQTRGTSTISNPLQLGGGLVPEVQEYKYLGILITTAFGLEGAAEERHVKYLVDKTKAAGNTFRPCLRHRNWPMDFKRTVSQLVILTRILPVASYGDAWVGMHQASASSRLR
jgi:hypothetical protein